MENRKIYSIFKKFRQINKLINYLKSISRKNWVKECNFLCKPPQCGNYRIVLSLIFYVKSTFGKFRVSESAILTISESQDFDF